MQLSQLENASFTLVMLDSALDIKLLLSKADCKLLAIIPPTPPLTLLAIATSMEGMMGQISAAQFGRISEIGNFEKSLGIRPPRFFVRGDLRILIVIYHAIVPFSFDRFL